MVDDMPHCDVSFAVASYNSLPYLDAAIESALAQVGVTVEVLVVDDHGTDDSKARAEWWQARDPRVRVFQTARNGGPSAARNIAIEHMRGRWYAVLDSDDLLDPSRSRTLIGEADNNGADLIADDLVLFGESMADRRFLPPELAAAESWIEPERYFAYTIMFGSAPNLGFLKPMIRRSAFEKTGIRYDTALRIAEDDALIMRLLLAGMRYRLWPEPLYHYRKHGASISHRLSLSNAERMLVSERRLRTAVEKAGLEGAGYRRRWRSIRRAEAFTRSINALKDRRPLAALAPLAADPGAAMLFSMPLAARLKRWIGRD